MEVIKVAETTNKCPYPTCGCIAYAYVPVQEFEENYSPCNALVQGTLFPELDLNINEYGKVCKKWGGVM